MEKAFKENLAIFDISETTAEHVMSAIVKTLIDGKTVQIPGVGRLYARTKRRIINAPGPNRGKGIEEKIAGLKYPATLSAGEPYEL